MFSLGQSTHFTSRLSSRKSCSPSASHQGPGCASLKAGGWQAKEGTQLDLTWPMLGEALSPTWCETASFTAWNLLLIPSQQEDSHWVREGDAMQATSSCDPFMFSLVPISPACGARPSNVVWTFQLRQAFPDMFYRKKRTFKIVAIKADLAVGFVACFIWMKPYLLHNIITNKNLLINPDGNYCKDDGVLNIPAKCGCTTTTLNKWP